ncbi:cysteine hydrolase family protein [Paenibacillus silvisoli]|uniref:cysteine hydrolase family protein n=1 Tax=Paenibacillus silvisoli TaxID=3110539 RepID=UPI002805383F|nr:cysteine hydrolase family protein [Paenibacillus silvisoli]
MTNPSSNTNTALLIIDVQTAMFNEENPVHGHEELLERIGGLLGRARAGGIPVIYVQHNEGVGEELETGSPAWEIHTAIAPKDGEPRIQKFKPDSFEGTDLRDKLTAKGISQLVIAGLQTDYCINATVTRAAELGYDVTVAGDAHSTWGQNGQSAEQIIEAHNARFSSFARIQPSTAIIFES